MSGPKIAIVIYTMYGHIAKRMCSTHCRDDASSLFFFFFTAVAEAEKAGIESAGGKATIFQWVQY